jgi:N-acetylneuraminic acid mutarotase
MPTPRSNVVSAVLGSKIYVVGGLEKRTGGNSSGKEEHVPSPAVEKLDTTTGTWLQVARLPEGTVKPAIGVVGGRIWILGGRCGDANTDSVLEYDPATDRWSKVAWSPVAARHPAACACGGKLFVSGGAVIERTWTGKTRSRMLSSVLALDPETRQFAYLPDLQPSRAAHAMIAVDDHLVVLGGVTEEKQFVRDVDVLDLKEGSWRTVGSLDSDRAVFEAGLLGSSVYLVGGWRRLHKEVNETCQALHLEVA